MLKRRVSTCVYSIIFSLCLWPTAQAQPLMSMQQLLEERQRLGNIWNDCKQQTDDWNQRAPAYAAQGQILPPPACTASMQQLIPQIWLNDIRIAHLNGDTRPGCLIEPMPGCEYWGE